MQTVSLDSGDIELLYSLCDYGSMSTDQNLGLRDMGRVATEIEHGTLSSYMPAQSAAVKDMDLSGHVDGIFAQMFGFENTESMVDNLSTALRQ